MDKYFPSTYTSPQDLATAGEVTLTMDRLVEETMPDLAHPGQMVAKPVIYFTNGHKPIVVNKGIGLALVTMYGDPPQVAGRPLTVFAEQFRGRLRCMARCIVAGNVVPAPGVPSAEELARAQAVLAAAKAAKAAKAKPAKRGKGR
jgi:hypothetical protein